MKDKAVGIILVILGIAALVGAQPQSSPVAAASQSPERYRIGAGDVLDIRIYNRPQLSRDAVRVEGDGMIRMPLIDGEIQAACRTEGELAKEISTRYARYYRNLPVDVFIKEYHAREVALIGAVTEQGRYQMQRRIRLLELLTFAKGPSDKAGQTINIVRAPRQDICAADPKQNDDGGF
ncbi:MAG TPA: polysaccharide biosynthesis/export family protein, partial [Pyrinomonadaceae bacterium]|nr:polysaccharide biosynthesis/export family protein [Pyrinomonadaceae bacterium]